jgi:hypothetical protein
MSAEHSAEVISSISSPRMVDRLDLRSGSGNTRILGEATGERV